ncbi:tetratricopeptide repeat protein [Salininema proteolyticum]|uniref:Tetratricopeptide repeat protein n=1 Tax=Salininema proteolyticum TaxID=1607685 RepID=A0ABV8TZ64_9ACTN
MTTSVDSRPRDFLESPSHLVHRTGLDDLTTELSGKWPRAVALTGDGKSGSTFLAKVAAGLVHLRYPGGTFYVDLREQSPDDAMLLSLIRLGASTDLIPSSPMGKSAFLRDLVQSRRVLPIVRLGAQPADAEYFHPRYPTAGFVVIGSPTPLDEYRVIEVPRFSTDERAELLSKSHGRLSQAVCWDLAENIVAGPRTVREAARAIAANPSLAEPPHDRLIELVRDETDLRSELADGLDGSTQWLYRLLHYLPEPIFEEAAAREFWQSGEQLRDALDELESAALVARDSVGYLRLVENQEFLADSTAEGIELPHQSALHDCVQSYTAQVQAADETIMRDRRRLGLMPTTKPPRNFESRGEAMSWLVRHRSMLSSMVHMCVEQEWWPEACALAEALWAFYTNQVMPDESIKCYRIALAASEHLPDTSIGIQMRLYLAKCLTDAGLTGDARRELETALSLSPTSESGERLAGTAYELLARNSLAADAGSAAWEFAEEGLRRLGQDGRARAKAQLWRFKARAAQSNGDYDVAAECFETALRLFGKASDSRNQALIDVEHALLDYDRYGPKVLANVEKKIAAADGMVETAQVVRAWERLAGSSEGPLKVRYETAARKARGLGDR